MKLYAQIDALDSIKSAGKGSNEKLSIRLSQGNNNVAQITFINDYIEIWTKDDTGDKYWNYKFQLKGNIQKLK